MGCKKWDKITNIYIITLMFETNVGNKWLKFLGFNLIDTVNYGYEKKPFNLMIKEIK